MGAVAVHVLAVVIVGMQQEEPPVDLALPASEQIAEVTFEPAPPQPAEPTPPPEEPETFEAPPAPVDPPEFIEEASTPPPARTNRTRSIAPLARPQPAGPSGGTMSISSAKAVAISAPRPEYPYEARRARITGSGVVLMTVDPTSDRVTSATMASEHREYYSRQRRDQRVPEMAV